MYQTRTLYGGVSLHVKLSLHFEVDIHGSGSPIIALDLGYQLHYGVVDFSCIGVDGGVGPYQLGFAVHGLMFDQVLCSLGCTSA